MEGCIYPFKTAEISAEGKVYGCSAGSVLSYSFGNIYEKPFNEIWNGAEAQEFRRQFFDKDYKYCNFEKCSRKKCIKLPDKPAENLPMPFRVQIYLNDDIPADFEKYIMPALKNAKLVNISTKNEFFENERAEKLVKKITAEYPEIKYAVCTKGIYNIEQGLKKYGIADKTAHIIINPDNNADDNNKIIENIKYLGKLKKEGKIKDAMLKIGSCSSEIKEAAENSDVIIQYKKAAAKICTVPFRSIDVNHNGDIYTCCPAFIKFNKIGNLKDCSFEEIWNGEAALALRNKILKGDYSMCDLDLCGQCETNDISMMTVKCSMPEYITLSYDEECNLHCLTCRDEQYINSKEQTENFNNQVYKLLKPVFYKAQEISISGSGEAFYSKHSKALIKKISAEHKQIKWRIYTNGVFFTSAACKALGIYGRINCVIFSLPSINREIYNKIMRGSDYDIVMKNIKEAVFECNERKSIKKVSINAVFSSINYTQMPAIAEFAKENNINLMITQCGRRNNLLSRNYEAVSVWDKNHPEFENFKKILRHPSLDYNRIAIAPLFQKIREGN